jgi:uncharacterized membrane protein
MMAAGAAIRQFFVLRHGFKLGRNRHPWRYALAGVVAIVLLIVWMRPVPNAIVSGAAPAASTGASAEFGYKTIEPILVQRCYACHGAAVQMKNVRLDSPQAVAQHAQALYTQAVVAKTMPLNNATGLTEAERSSLKAWFEAGASVR